MIKIRVFLSPDNNSNKMYHDRVNVSRFSLFICDLNSVFFFTQSCSCRHGGIQKRIKLECHLLSFSFGLSNILLMNIKVTC